MKTQHLSTVSKQCFKRCLSTLDLLTGFAFFAGEAFGRVVQALYVLSRGTRFTHSLRISGAFFFQSFSCGNQISSWGCIYGVFSRLIYPKSPSYWLKISFIATSMTLTQWGSLATVYKFSFSLRFRSNVYYWSDFQAFTVVICAYQVGISCSTG